MTGFGRTAEIVEEKLIEELAEDRAIDRADVRVDIFVVEGCYSCIYAKEVAAKIRVDFPAVRVRLVDINTTPHPIPDAVFATPTYLLNDQLWSLGNPSPQDIQERLSPSQERHHHER
jgi:hypothetical protein